MSRMGEAEPAAAPTAVDEAALVAGTNPELDALAAAQRAKGEKPKTTPLRDAVLQRALDFVTALSVYATKPPLENR